MLTRAELDRMIDDGSVETVCLAFTDHYGRLCGKMMAASFFKESPRTACCNYLLAVDMVGWMASVQASHLPAPSVVL